MNVQLPMLTLNGLLMNTFMGNAFTDKDTGEIIVASLKIQMLCDVPQKAGGIKKELVTMSAKDETQRDLYAGYVGKVIRIGVGVIAQGRNLNFWILPNSAPELVPDLATSPEKPKDIAPPPMIKSPLGN